MNDGTSLKNSFNHLMQAPIINKSYYWSLFTDPLLITDYYLLLLLIVLLIQSSAQSIP